MLCPIQLFPVPKDPQPYSQLQFDDCSGQRHSACTSSIILSVSSWTKSVHCAANLLPCDVNAFFFTVKFWTHCGFTAVHRDRCSTQSWMLQKQGGLRIWRFSEIIYFLILSDEVILHQLLQSIFWQKNRNFEAILDFIVDIRFKKWSCGDYNHLRQMLLGHHRCSQWWSDAGVSELQSILGIEQRLLAQLHLLPQCRKDHTCWTGWSLSGTCCVKNNFFCVADSFRLLALITLLFTWKNQMLCSFLVTIPNPYLPLVEY